MSCSTPFVALALLLVGASGCQSKSEAPKPAPSASAAPAATSATARPPATAPAPGALPEGDVRSFVARWEAAQNQGDFDAYSRAYAERFMGVKRVGTYSKRFDRRGWLADRKPMFDAGAKVKVTELSLSPAAGATRAIFTQHFESGSFRDVGKKELFLIAAPGGIAIGREEMLSSEVSETSATDESVMAYHRDGVVLQRRFDKQRLKSRPRLSSVVGASPVDVAFDVARDELPEAARGWLGREVTTYTAEGQTCSGRVARFQVRVQAVPHFGMLQQWQGGPGTPAAAQQIAETIAGMAQPEEHFVVGVLDHACAGSWATAAALPFTAAVPAAAKLREAALSGLKKLPAYGALQQRFVKEGGDASRGWETVDGRSSVVELRVKSHATWLLVSAHGGAGCASFNGSLSALFELGGSAEAPKLSPGPSFNQFLSLRGALDQGPAGLALLTGPDSYDDEVAVVRLGPKPSRRVLHATSFWDCDC